MPRCSFCKQVYEFPRGLSFILNDGNILYFCSSKCKKNQLKLKRDSKKVNWVRKFESETSKESSGKIIQQSSEMPKEKKTEAKPAKQAQKAEAKTEAKPAEKPAK
jgi:large subunit ribosomal protein L24e